MWGISSTLWCIKSCIIILNTAREHKFSYNADIFHAFHVIPMFNHKFLIIHFCAASKHASTYTTSSICLLDVAHSFNKNKFFLVLFSLILHKSHTNMCVVLHSWEAKKSDEMDECAGIERQFMARTSSKNFFFILLNLKIWS